MNYKISQLEFEKMWAELTMLKMKKIDLARENQYKIEKFTTELNFSSGLNDLNNEINELKKLIGEVEVKNEN